MLGPLLFSTYICILLSVISTKPMVLNIIWMLMTAEFVSPAQTSLLNFSLIYLTASVTSPLAYLISFSYLHPKLNSEA